MRNEVKDTCKWIRVRGCHDINSDSLLLPSEKKKLYRAEVLLMHTQVASVTHNVSDVRDKMAIRSLLHITLC